MIPQPMLRRPGSMPRMRIADAPMLRLYLFPGHLPTPRRLGGRARSIFGQHPLEQFDLFRKPPVGADQTLDLADGMQNGGVIAAAKAPANLGQGAWCQRLGKEHGDLARTYDIGSAPRGENVSFADVVMAGDKLLDIFDFDPFRLARADKILDRPFRRFETEGCAVQGSVRNKPVDGAIEIAAVCLNDASDIGEDRR